MIRLRLARSWADQTLTRANLRLVAEADACRTDCQRYDTALIEMAEAMEEQDRELADLRASNKRYDKANAAHAQTNADLLHDVKFTQQRRADLAEQYDLLAAELQAATARVEAYERQAQPMIADTQPGAAGMAQHPAWTATRDEIAQEIKRKRLDDGLGD